MLSFTFPLFTAMASFLPNALIQTPTPLSVLLDQFREEKFTGLACTGQAGALRLQAIFYAGDVKAAYLISQDARPVRLDDNACAHHLTAFGALPGQTGKLPAYALRLIKLFTESAGDGDARQVDTADIVSMLPDWQSLGSPSLLSFHWPSADALMYLPGCGSYARHSVFVAGARVEQEIIPAIETWSEPTCKIIRHAPIAGTPGWHEYHLHLAFTAAASALMTRYEQFGGRPIITDLTNQMIELANLHDWNIGIVGNKVFERHLFPNDRQAARAYRALLSAILSHSEAVLGMPRTLAMVTAFYEQSEVLVREYLQGYDLVPLNHLAGGG